MELILPQGPSPHFRPLVCDAGPVHVIPVGRDAALVEVADAAEALSLATWARSRVPATEVVPAARTVLFDGAGIDPDALAELLGGWRPEAVEAGALVVLDVVWDGPDLAAVEEVWGRPAVEVLTGCELTVAFCGFAPGFPYLTGLPAGRPVPRRASPRSRVPAGSVALAGDYAGIYPGESPGGWQLVGRTEAVLWDPSLESPALLPPGTRVRLR